jgi:Tol biopolymer transport system component
VFTPGVAYLADAEVDERIELFVADLDGDGALKVSGQLVAGGDVRSFQWSPDGAFVAFLADKDTDNVFELYGVAAAGGNVMKLSGPLVPGGQIFGYAWSPDSLRVAYVADAETVADYALFVAPIGGPVVRASGPMVAGGDVTVRLEGCFAWAPNGSRIAYAADQDTDGRVEVYTSLPNGLGNVKVSGTFVAGGSLFGDLFNDYAWLRWAGDSSALAYIADQDTDGVLELYRSLPDGTSNLKLSGPLPANHNVWAFAWSPDSTRVGYVEASFAGPQVSDAHVVAATGGVPVPVSLQHTVNAILWSPDSTRLAYGVGEPFSGNPTNVHLVDPDGTDPAGPLVALRGIYFDGFRVLENRAAWSPTSSRLALSPSGGGLMTLAKDGLSLAGLADVSGAEFRWAPDASRIAYKVVLGTTADLYVSHPHTSFGSDVVSAPLLPGRRVNGFEWTPDSSRLVYSADLDTNDELELFAVAADGSNHLVVSGPLVFGGQVLEFAIR